jgi:hypothetical protein
MRVWVLYAVLISSDTGQEARREPIESFDDPIECLTALGRQPIQRSFDHMSKYFECTRIDAASQ